MKPPRERSVAVDVLRGLTVAAMIVVNTPGTWSAIYPPLRHADWHGLTPTDLVFPFFLFIVGVSIALAYSPGTMDAPARAAARGKILWRATKIFAVGVFLNLWPDFAWGEIRFAGVLQRIAVVFAAVALLHLYARRRTLVTIAILLLVGYWAALSWIPVPRDVVVEEALASGTVPRAHSTVAVTPTVRGPHHIEANLQPGINLAAWLDRHLLPGRRYERTWDPEGILSTLPASATALLGVLAGLLFTRSEWRARRSATLAGAGLAALLVGLAWSQVFPLNKNLWTSSFVMVAAGWCLLSLAVCSWLIDDHGWRRPFLPAIAFGMNAITAYALASMSHRLFTFAWFERSVADMVMNGVRVLGGSRELASLGFALFYTTLIFIPIYVLYRRRVFIRL